MPNGQHGPTARLNFVGREKRHNLVNNWMGLPIDRPGSLVFEAVLNEDPVAHHEITVHPPEAGRYEGYLVPNAPPPGGGG